MKKAKQTKTGNPKVSSGDSHVSHSSMGMGDYYGTGIKNPMGRMRDGVGMVVVTPKKLKNPPKSLA